MILQEVRTQLSFIIRLTINNVVSKYKITFTQNDSELITYSNFSKNNNKYFKEFKKEVKDNFVYIDSESQTQTQNIRTAIVCIAANENLYIRDFVK